MTRREKIMNRIHNERDRQDELWGEQLHLPADWMPILIEEVGEVAKAINEGDVKGYPVELIQVAAVAVSMVECFEKNLPGRQSGIEELINESDTRKTKIIDLESMGQELLIDAMSSYEQAPWNHRKTAEEYFAEEIAMFGLPERSKS